MAHPQHPDPQLPHEPVKFDAAIAAWRKRDPMPKADWEALQADERDYAWTVAGVAQADVVSDVWDAIDSSVENGTPFAEFKADVGAKLEEAWGGEKPGRLETIFRTNVNGAYNEGRHSVFTAPKVLEARPYWRYELIDDSDLCDICQDCKGVILPADDEWWSENLPPLHFRCRCSFTALSRQEANDEGIDAEGPDTDPDEGFGEAPSEKGTDWADPDDYAPPIGDVLDHVLDR